MTYLHMKIFDLVIDGGGMLLMQVTRFLIRDRFIHCNTFSAKHFNEEEFIFSRGMLFQMTGPEYERLSLKILR